MTQETHGTDIIDLQPPPKPSKAKFDAKAYHRKSMRGKTAGGGIKSKPYKELIRDATSGNFRAFET